MLEWLCTIDEYSRRGHFGKSVKHMLEAGIPLQFVNLAALNHEMHSNRFATIEVYICNMFYIF